MSEDESEGLLDAYTSIQNGWLEDSSREFADPREDVTKDVKRMGKRTKVASTIRVLHHDDSGLLGPPYCSEDILHNDELDSESSLETSSGGYLLSASRTASNSSECTDTTSSILYSSSDSSDSEDNFIDSTRSTEPTPRRPPVHLDRPAPFKGHKHALTIAGALDVPPASVHHAGQPLVKGKHGLRVTRSRLSINALPNLLSEKTEELDLDYREINVNELELEERPVGKGAFGTIYKGYWRGAKVAIKKLNVLSMSEKELYEFRHEVALMKSLCNHPNVVDFIGACTTPPHFCLVSKFYANGSVKDYLCRQKDVPWITIVRFARDAAAGVLHLHCEHVIHRDLAARNLLVDDNLNVRVSDFGLARRITSQAQENTSSLLPVAYMAPESIRKREYSIKSDSFSFGIFLWEMVTRQQPWAGMPLLEVAFGVTIEGLRLTIPDSCPLMFRQLMSKCWETNPEDRPDFYELFLTLEEYLETLEIEAQQERDRKRREELTKRMETNNPTYHIIPAAPSEQEGPRRVSGRLPLRIRSTPMMGKQVAYSSFDSSIHPLDRGVEASVRMARSESLLLDKKIVDKHTSSASDTSAPQEPEEIQHPDVNEDIPKGEETPMEESPKLQNSNVGLSQDGGTFSTYKDASARRKVGWIDQEEQRIRSCERLALISKDHSIDSTHITDQFPFENGTHSLICKARLILPEVKQGSRGVPVAIKRLCNFFNREDSTREDLLRQAEILLAAQSCSHIVRFLGAHLAPDNEFLVFKWVKHGSLAQLMYGLGRRWKKLRKQKPLLLVRMAHDIASAMHFLHEKGILHANLEPKNILLDSKYRAVLCGFTLARYVKDESLAPYTDASFRQPQSSLLFTAPELWNAHLHSKAHEQVRKEEADEIKATSPSHSSKTVFASDVYSFGMILWTLWHGFSHEELKKRRQLVSQVLSSCTNQHGIATERGPQESLGMGESMLAEREAKEEEDRRRELVADKDTPFSHPMDASIPHHSRNSKEPKPSLRDLMLADHMPNDWLNLTTSCLSYDPDLRPSFDVIVPTLKNIWKNWKNSLETHGDISQANLSQEPSVSFPDATLSEVPFPATVKIRSPETRSGRDEDDGSDTQHGDADSESETDSESLSRSLSSTFSSNSTIFSPSQILDTPNLPSQVPSSLDSINSFSLSPTSHPIRSPSMRRATTSSPSFSFSRKDHINLRLSIDGDGNSDEGDTLDNYEEKSVLACVPSVELRPDA